MGNIDSIGSGGSMWSPIPPLPGDKKTEKEVKGLSSSSETQASSYAASQNQIESTIRNFLTQKFGDDTGNKIADKAISELKGKNLSFKVVKEVILGATKKQGETISNNDLDNLLKPLLPSKDESSPKPWEREFNPYGAEIFQNKQRVKSAKAEAANEEATIKSEAKQDLEKQQEIKDQEIKKRKPLDPEKRV